MHIFILSRHLGFGNCGGLGRGSISRGSRHYWSSIQDGSIKILIYYLAFCSKITPALQANLFWDDIQNREKGSPKWKIILWCKTDNDVSNFPFFHTLISLVLILDVLTEYIFFILLACARTHSLLGFDPQTIDMSFLFLSHLTSVV